MSRLVPRFAFPNVRLALANTLLGAIVLVVCLVLVEVGGRILLGRNVTIISNVDHRMTPGSAPDLNADGIRSARSAAEFDSPGLNIVFLGDSFVYGFNLTRDQAIPAVFENIARRDLNRGDIRVANFGWVSSSPLLSLRLLQDIGAKYRPQVVLLAVDMTDFSDDIKYRRLLNPEGIYRVAGWLPASFLLSRKVVSLASDSLHQSLFGFPARRFFITEQPLEDSRRFVMEMQASIDEIARFTTQVLDAKFVLFVFPRTYQYSARESPRNWEADEYQTLGPYAREPFRYLDEIRGKVEYPVFSLLEDFKTTQVFPTAFDDDPHWTEAGTRVAAGAIHKYCLQAGCYQ